MSANHAHQHELFVLPPPAARPPRAIATTPEIDALLAAHAPVALSISGGKDSVAMTFAVARHLDAIGHRGPRVLVFADLGSIEWRDSYHLCRRLAKATGIPLAVVRYHRHGFARSQPFQQIAAIHAGLIDRYHLRWRENKRYYAQLERVKLVLPWPTSLMRYCTAETKSDPIADYLKHRFPGTTIVSASGIRAEESAKRAQRPVCQPDLILTRKTTGTDGLTWLPIKHWTTQDTFDEMAANHFTPADSYQIHHASRHSCSFCFQGAQADLRAAAACPDNRDAYVALCRLEISSTFSYRSDHYLSDLAPDLLPTSLSARLCDAKRRARARQDLEAQIPSHLLYCQGWPVAVPTPEEAALLARVRTGVAALISLPINFDTPTTVIARYRELIALKQRKDRTSRPAAPYQAHLHRTAPIQQQLLPTGT